MTCKAEVTTRLLTPKDIEPLMRHHRLILAGRDSARLPIIARFFTPDAQAQWVILSAEVWGDDDLRLYGWCDLGFGFSEMGYVLLSKIEQARGCLGLLVERDIMVGLHDHQTLDSWLEIEFDT